MVIEEAGDDRIKGGVTEIKPFGGHDLKAAVWGPPFFAGGFYHGSGGIDACHTATEGRIEQCADLLAQEAGAAA